MSVRSSLLYVSGVLSKLFLKHIWKLSCCSGIWTSGCYHQEYEQPTQNKTRPPKTTFICFYIIVSRNVYSYFDGTNSFLSLSFWSRGQRSIDSWLQRWFIVKGIGYLSFYWLTIVLYCTCSLFWSLWSTICQRNSDMGPSHRSQPKNSLSPGCCWVNSEEI